GGGQGRPGAAAGQVPHRGRTCPRQAGPPQGRLRRRAVAVRARGDRPDRGDRPRPGQAVRLSGGWFGVAAASRRRYTRALGTSLGHSGHPGTAGTPLPGRDPEYWNNRCLRSKRISLLIDPNGPLRQWCPTRPRVQSKGVKHRSRGGTVAWETRNGRRYYYQSVRIDGRATKRYLGTDQAAKAAAADVAQRQADRHA